MMKRAAKPGLTPSPARPGFWQALQDLQIARAYVVARVARRYLLAQGVRDSGGSADRDAGKTASAVAARDRPLGALNRTMRAWTGKVSKRANVV